MALKSGIGLSTNEDLIAAAREAALGAKSTCPEAAVALVFVTHNYPVDDLAASSKAVSDVFGSATQIVGGTVNGLTFGEERYDALFSNRHAVAVVAFGGVKVGVGFVENPIKAPFEAGRRLAQQVQKEFRSRANGGILLSTGLAAGLTPVDQPMLDGIRAINPRLRLAGTGLSGPMRVDGTVEGGFALFNGRVEKLGCVLVAFGEEVDLGFATANGMVASGGGGFVTEADGLVIKTIDGRPAREAIVNLLAGENDPEARALFEKNPMVMSIERGVALGTADPEGDFYWCHLPAHFTPDGGVVDYFGAHTGVALSVVKIDPQRCMLAIHQAADMMKEDAKASDFEAVIAFSSSLRGFTLGAEVAHEDKELRGCVNAKHLLGVVANGEIGCYRHGRPFYTGWVYALFGLAHGGE